MLDFLCFDARDVEQMIVRVFAPPHEALRVAIDVQARGTACLVRLVEVASVHVDLVDGGIAE